ncbi:hypothetical protein ACFLQW_00695 [Candidatus Zixiibacteriota bacterium]
MNREAEMPDDSNNDDTTQSHIVLSKGMKIGAGGMMSKASQPPE